MSRPSTVSPQTLELLIYSLLPQVGQKTLLRTAPAIRTGHSPMEARLKKALAEPGALQLAQQRAEAVQAACQSHGVHLISPLDPDYPAALLGMGSEMPPLLYVQGSLSAAGSLAIVGTRSPTPHGVEMTRRITTHFAQRGWSIVSGLATGIDATAHQAALDAGGHTVAVLAHGHHTVAPREHTLLARFILAKGGATISEYPPGVEPLPAYFVQRDRIQAGLAQGTVVIQTDLDGGSWHACRATIRYGRPLAYPLPSRTDLESGAEKIRGIALLNSSGVALCEQLHCTAQQLQQLYAIHGKENYRQLEELLERDRASSGVGTLFGSGGVNP